MMMQARCLLALAATTVVIAASGCNQSEQAPEQSAEQPAAQEQAQTAKPAATGDPSSVEITPEARAEAEQIFKTRCSVCHGEHGKGDGPGSANLDPKPRNFTDSEWQKSVTDEHIHKIIQYGGAAVGKAPTMPGNPDLISKPAVVAGLREHIRQLAGK